MKIGSFDIDVSLLLARIGFFFSSLFKRARPILQTSGAAVRNALPNRSDPPEMKWLKFIVYACLAVLMLTVMISFLVFLFTLEGAEQTLVPDVRDAELSEALIALQDKELYARIQMRFSSDPASKGRILGQSPSPGTIVKAGRRVTLVVSRGAIVERVENYIGKRLDEVRSSLQAAFAAFTPLISIREPVIHVFDPAPPGTILQQNPKPGTELSAPTELELVVSRGPEPERVRLPAFTGLETDEAIARLSAAGIPFVFQAGEPGQGRQRGRIFGQEPPEGETVLPGTVVTLQFTFEQRPPAGKVFGVFEYRLPEYPIPVDLKVESVAANGARSELFTMKHPGGPISFPYAAEENSTIVLSVFNREIIRHVVTRTTF